MLILELKSVMSAGCLSWRTWNVFNIWLSISYIYLSIVWSLRVIDCISLMQIAWFILQTSILCIIFLIYFQLSIEKPASQFHMYALLRVKSIWVFFRLRWLSSCISGSLLHKTCWKSWLSRYLEIWQTILMKVNTGARIYMKF